MKLNEFTFKMDEAEDIKGISPIQLVDETIVNAKWNEEGLSLEMKSGNIYTIIEVNGKIKIFQK